MGLPAMETPPPRMRLVWVVLLILALPAGFVVGYVVARLLIFG